MIIEVDKSFKKDFIKLKNHQLEKKVINKIESLEKTESLQTISSLKSMKWFTNFYRIRMWDYRIWFKLDWETIILLRIRHRKDIYNIFP